MLCITSNKDYPLKFQSSSVCCENKDITSEKSCQHLNRHVHIFKLQFQRQNLTSWPSVPAACEIPGYFAAAWALGSSFFPFALESYGRFGKSFEGFLKDLADAYCDRAGVDIARCILIRSWRQRLSVTLQRQNARVILRRASRLQSSCQETLPNQPDFAELQYQFAA
jgi:hypothetical protein